MSKLLSITQLKSPSIILCSVLYLFNLPFINLLNVFFSLDIFGECSFAIKIAFSLMASTAHNYLSVFKTLLTSYGKVYRTKIS